MEALVVQETKSGLAQYSPNEVLSQVKMIQELIEKVMKQDEHYGIIPGTNKPTLYKAGAEKLGFTFRLAPKFSIDYKDLQEGHREYIITCSLTHINTGCLIGEGLGSCATLESKYRYRDDIEDTGENLPKDYKEKKQEYKKQGLVAKKIDGVWKWLKINGKKENLDIADQYNTVLKMAKKRAHIDAMLTATAASDIFSQELEDLPKDMIKNNNDKMDSPEDIKQRKELLVKISAKTLKLAKLTLGENSSPEKLTKTQDEYLNKYSEYKGKSLKSQDMETTTISRLKIINGKLSTAIKNAETFEEKSEEKEIEIFDSTKSAEIDSNN